jgi:hypothetical protein
MFLRVLKFSFTAWKTGRTHGHPVPRYPLAWLPLLLALPVAAAGLLLFVLFLLLLPVIALTGGIAWLTLGGKKRRAFAEQADQGIPFDKVEGRFPPILPILEAEVVRDESRERGARD